MAVKVLLKEIRDSKKLSLNALGRLTELSPQYLSRIERGGHNPTLETINRLCKALQVQPGDLLVYVPDGDEKDYGLNIDVEGD